MSLIISVSGIRGTIGGIPGENLTPPDIVKFSTAYGSMLKTRFGQASVVIGRDGRVSGKMVSELVANTLISLGIGVIDIGLSTTPTVEMAVTRHSAHGGIIITASHNPSQWNALKLLNELGEFISEKEGNELLRLALETKSAYQTYDQLGSVSTSGSDIEHHIDQILKLPLTATEEIRRKRFHVVADVVNSTGAMAIPALLEALNCTYELINPEVNGLFAHNPEPLEENLRDLMTSVGKGSALGIAVDPDVDRLAMVDEKGRYIGEEYSLVCVADYVLRHKPGNTVSNLSSSRALADLTKKLGGTHFASKVGEVHVVEKMKNVGAVIGGEGNGGIILPDLHYGRDALVGVALVLSHMAASGQSLSALRDGYPHYEMFKDKIALSPEVDYENLLKHIRGAYASEKINLEDGIRIDMQEGWLHLRKSNTEPIIRIYSEASSADAAKRLVDRMKETVSKF